MDIQFLGKGILIGFSIAAPVGPIGILCIRRTLAQGRMSGLATGLGAATADAFYGTVAGFGLTLISRFLVSQSTWLRLLGGGFLCYLGVVTFLSKPSDTVVAEARRGMFGSYVSALGLTLTNPMTILSFAAVFAGLGLADLPGRYLASACLVLGTFLGSALWWLLLTQGISLLHTRVKKVSLDWINRVSGIILLGFGLSSLASLLL